MKNIKNTHQYPIILFEMFESLGLDTYEKVRSFYEQLPSTSNGNKKSEYYYENYIEKRKSKKLADRLWLKGNEPRTDSGKQLVSYFESLPKDKRKQLVKCLFTEQTNTVFLNRITEDGSREEFVFECRTSLDDVKDVFAGLEEENISFSDFMKKLKSISESSIPMFIYKKDFDLEGEYYFGNGGYTFSDGKKTYKGTSSNISIEIENPKFIIYNERFSSFGCPTLVVNSFSFSIDAIPSLDELRNPEIGEEDLQILNRKKQIVEAAYYREKYLTRTMENLRCLKAVLPSLDTFQISCTNGEVNSYIENPEQLEVFLLGLVSKETSSALEEGTITEEELTRGISRVKQYDEYQERSQYYDFD